MLELNPATVNVDPNETDPFSVESSTSSEASTWTQFTTTSERWTASTVTQPGKTLATDPMSLTTSVSATTTTEVVTEAVTTTTTTTTTSIETEPKLMQDAESMASSGNALESGKFREDLDEELRESFPNAGNSSISRQKGFQRDPMKNPRNATSEGNSRKISQKYIRCSKI